MQLILRPNPDPSNMKPQSGAPSSRSSLARLPAVPHVVPSERQHQAVSGALERSSRAPGNAQTSRHVIFVSGRRSCLRINHRGKRDGASEGILDAAVPVMVSDRSGLILPGLLTITHFRGPESASVKRPAPALCVCCLAQPS